MQSLWRVTWFNRHMLSTALLLDMMFMFFTATALYYFRPASTAVEDPDMADNFKSIGAAFYLSVLMLTGQGLPEGFVLPGYTKVMVMITAIFSVAVFAIPAGIITWGFEAEAERLAWKNRDEKKRQQASAKRKLARCRKKLETEVAGRDRIVDKNILLSKAQAMHVYLRMQDLDSSRGIASAMKKVAEKMVQAKPERSLCDDLLKDETTSSGSSASSSSEWEMPEAIQKQTSEWAAYEKVILGSDQEDADDTDKKMLKEVVHLFNQHDKNMSGDLDVSEVYNMIKKMQETKEATTSTAAKDSDRVNKQLQVLIDKVDKRDKRLDRLESQLDKVLKHLDNEGL